MGARDRSGARAAARSRARRGGGRRVFDRAGGRAGAYLDLLRHRLDLRLGVRDADEVAVGDEVQRVARRAHLLVDLVPAADGVVVVRVEHPLVRPGVLRAVQPVLGLVRERDAREPEEGRGARAERGEPLLRGAPALRGKLPRARDRGARRGGRRRGSRARGLRRETKHAGGRPVGPSTRPAPVKCGARAVITTRWRGRVDDDADALKSRTGARRRPCLEEKIFSIGERTGIGLKSRSGDVGHQQTLIIFRFDDTKILSRHPSEGARADLRLVSKVASVAFSLVSPREPPPPLPS